MTFTSDTDIDHIGRGLIERTLPKSEWTHAAHFAAAIWLLDHPDIDPFKDMPGFIRAYNEATGVENTDTDGYHETITLASLRAAKHILDNAPAGRSLFEIVNDLLASPYGSPGWILDYWSKEVLFSINARKTWIDPDQVPLPF